MGWTVSAFQCLRHFHPTVALHAARGGLRALTALAIAAAMLAGCADRPAPRPAKAPRIASLVPSATDLLVAMGAGEHLVAISNWCHEQPATAGLPRVGDEQSADWEMIARLAPQVMIIQKAQERMPEGFRQAARRLNIRLVNVKNDRLDDVFQTIAVLGEAAQEPDKAANLAAAMRGKLQSAMARVAGRLPVPTALVIDERGRSLAGPGTFLDDLLTLAGGRNVAAGLGAMWPGADAEQLAALAPQAIIQLLPGAREQVARQAREAWSTMPDLPAVKAGRVYILSEWYVLQPGSRLGELAEKLAECLHPTAPSSQPPASRPAPHPRASP